jgi:ATP-dependent Clp protease adaptor protein ClpS
MIGEDILELTGTITEKVTEHRLIVWNDEVNSFEWVILSFMDILKWDLIQGEQVALIIHYKGKCEVKRGEWDDLKVFKDALIDRGLNVTIE